MWASKLLSADPSYNKKFYIYMSLFYCKAIFQLIFWSKKNIRYDNIFTNLPEVAVLNYITR